MIKSPVIRPGIFHAFMVSLAAGTLKAFLNSLFLLLFVNGPCAAAESAGGHFLPFAEGGTEAAFRTETAGKSDLLNIHLSGLQQVFCLVDPGRNHILMGREAGFRRENAGEIIGA